MRKNRIRCAKCKDIIESTFRHDCKFCGCGAAMVDGGQNYCRYGGEPENIIIVYDDDSEVSFEKILSESDKENQKEDDVSDVSDPVTDNEIEELHEKLEEKNREISQLKLRVKELESRKT